MKFLRCNHCGNLVAMIKDAGPIPVCCGEKMEVLVAKTVEGAGEKHRPVVEVAGNTVTVKVGEVAHPMTEEHHIEWVVLETKFGNIRKDLTTEPKATFLLEEGNEVINAYAYCNLHGLWKAFE